MKSQTIKVQTMENTHEVIMSYGSIFAKEESGDSVHLYVGSEALNDAIDAYLANCDSKLQKRFMQALNEA